MRPRPLCTPAREVADPAARRGRARDRARPRVRDGPCRCHSADGETLSGGELGVGLGESGVGLGLCVGGLCVGGGLGFDEVGPGPGVGSPPPPRLGRGLGVRPGSPPVGDGPSGDGEAELLGELLMPPDVGPGPPVSETGPPAGALFTTAGRSPACGAAGRPSATANAVPTPPAATSAVRPVTARTRREPR